MHTLGGLCGPTVHRMGSIGNEYSVKFLHNHVHKVRVYKNIMNTLLGNVKTKPITIICTIVCT